MVRFSTLTNLCRGEVLLLEHAVRPRSSKKLSLSDLCVRDLVKSRNLGFVEKRIPDLTSSQRARIPSVIGSRSGR